MNLVEKGWIKVIKCFIVPCEKATYLETKSKYEPLSFREKLNLNMHMLKCSYCRTYRTEQNLLSKCLAKFRDDIEHDKLYFRLSDEAKEKINQALSSEKR